MALDTIILNGTEYSLSGGASEYKTADKTEWVFTLTAGTTLENTRISSLTEVTVSGVTTYLIPNANIPVDTGFVKISGTTYWVGYYTEDGDARTYAAATGAYYANDSYTGLAVCMYNSNGTLDDIAFMYRMSVITTKNTSIDIPGFSGYETDAYLTFTGGSNRVPVYLPVESDKVYAIKFSDFTFYQMWAVKTWTSYFSGAAQAKYAIMGDYVIIPSIDGYLAWTMTSTSDFTTMYETDGLEIFVLDKPWEIIALRKTVPCRPFIHAGNFKHQVLIAYALGWSGVETDVRTTSDGEFILSHDATLGGLTIEDSTYADILAAYPGVLTVDELIDISAYFDCSIDFHFQAVSDNDKWTILIKGLKKNIDHLGYYTGTTGNIGTVSVNTFYENGLVYGYADEQDIPSTIEAAAHYVRGYASASLIEQYPQLAYILPSTGTSSSVVITNESLHTTYEPYFDTISYFARNYPLYDAICQKLTLKESTLTFTASGSKKLTPVVLPIYCSNSISWESSDTSVATVTGGNANETLYPQATVTAVGNGTCTITATCGNMQATCTVSVSGLS